LEEIDREFDKKTEKIADSMVEIKHKRYQEDWPRRFQGWPRRFKGCPRKLQGCARSYERCPMRLKDCQSSVHKHKMLN